jgi:hypothetical protein
MKTTKYLLIAASLIACAGATPNARAADEAITLELPERPPYRQFTLGVDAATTGFGGAFSWRFQDHFGARVGADYFSRDGAGMEINGIHYKTDLRILFEPLTFDIYPWTQSSFHISVGVMFNQNRLTGTADQVGTIVINGHPFPAETVGQLHMKIEQQLVNPYLSIGGNFFYFDRAHHWAMGGELGVAYTGEPDTSLTRSGPAAPLVDQAVKGAERKLDDYANKFKWWPVVKLNVTYSF